MNGWHNYPTRAAWLHLTNDEASCNWLRHVVATLPRDAACATLSAAIINSAASHLSETSLEFDLLRWAISSINFEEIVAVAREQEQAA